MRLIDADDILKILKEHAKYFIPNYQEDNYEAGVLEGLALAECEVNEMPSVEERKHGHWIKLFDPHYGIIGVECSVCKGEMRRATEYCPFCGAVMNEESAYEQ